MRTCRGGVALVSVPFLASCDDGMCFWNSGEGLSRLLVGPRVGSTFVTIIRPAWCVRTEPSPKRPGSS